MYLITVIPIAKGVGKETLSYFSKHNVTLGVVISVPIRSKEVKAVVISVLPAEAIKGEIKELTFSLKKISSPLETTLFPDFVIQSAKETADYHATTIGDILQSIVPTNFLSLQNGVASKEKIERNTFEEIALQLSNQERIDMYKSIIRESFAKKESVFLVLPTEDNIEMHYQELSKGIEKYVYKPQLCKTISSLTSAIEKLSLETHPVVIIGTHKASVFLPISTKTILVEEESSRHYKGIKRPFLNAKTYLKILAKSLQAKIIYGDELLSIETYGKVTTGMIHEYTRLTHKINKPINTLVVEQKKDPGAYNLLSKELEEMIAFNEQKKSHMFLFVPRRGLALQTICLDCGKTIFCESCEAPLVLHEHKKGRMFMCHHCGYKKNVDVLCTTCGGWNLKGYGVGSGVVKETIEALTGKTPLLLDKEHTSTKKQETVILKKFETEGGILIGGERALSLLKENSVAYGVLVSVDALLSLPDFRVEEKIMHLMTDLKKKVTTCLLLQTKDKTQDIIELGLGGEVGNFQKRELALRKKFGYPPEKILIKISITEEKEKAKKLSSFVMDILKDYAPMLFPAFIKSIKGKTVAHILLKVDPAKYPNETLKNKLLSLPPSVAVNVSPQSLL